MKRILFILFFVPVLVLAQSEGFLEPTFNTLIEKTYFKDLYQNGSANYDWEIIGEGMVKEGDYYTLSNGSSLLSDEIDDSTIVAINLVFNIRTYGGSLKDNKYFVGIEYESGESIEKTFDSIPNKFVSLPIKIDSIKPEKFKIRIRNQRMNSSSNIYVNNVVVYAKRTSPSILFEPSNTGFLVSTTDYDECIIELYRQEYLESGIDTLYFNDFNTDDLSGMTLNTSYSISNGLLSALSKKFDICAAIPFFPNRSIDKINLQCLFKIIYPKQNHNVNVYYNDEFIVEKKLSGSGGDVIDFSYDIDTRHTFIDSLKFVIRYDGDKTANLALEKVLLSQNCEYKYLLLEDFPKQMQFPFYVDGLDCTSSYRVRYQLIDNENEKGEKVVTSLAEGFISTTGEYKELPPDSEFTLESDFEGTIMISNKSNLYGNYSVLGELCYVHEYNPDEWASVALPFKPQRIGAFKNGEGFYLRENKDFYLRSYSETADSFQFVDSESFEPYKGYILKIPDGMDFDNNALFIYSPRKITVNEPYSYVFENLYSHVANPYTYSLNYKDNNTEIESLFQGNIIYKFDGTSFKILSSDDIILPFESVIVFSGGVNAAPRIINLEKDISDLTNDTKIYEFISVFEDGFEIHGYEGPVEIYGIDGNLIIKTYNISGERINVDSKGVYIVRFGNNINKILL